MIYFVFIEVCVACIAGHCFPEQQLGNLNCNVKSDAGIYLFLDAVVYLLKATESCTEVDWLWWATK
jgi:hypothetical protein